MTTSLGRYWARALAALYDPVVGVADRRFFERFRAAQAAELEGAVLDVGAGTGRSLSYLAASSDVEAVYALEPDPWMRARARHVAADLDRTVVIGGVGEAIPVADGRLDAAVVSLALCTVDDRDAVRRELARVVAPGGEVRLFEHVRGDGWRGRAQRAIAGPWRRLAGGCDVTARQHEAYLDDPAFEVLEATVHHVGIFPIRPLVTVRLRRRDSA